MKELITQADQLLQDLLDSEIDSISPEESEILSKFTRNIENISVYREIFGIKR